MKLPAPRVPAKALGHGHHVRRSSGRNQFTQRFEYQPMVRAIEIFGGDNVGHLVPGRLVDQQRAQYRLLGLDRMRWNQPFGARAAAIAT